jgi:hypothetical protein
VSTLLFLCETLVRKKRNEWLAYNLQKQDSPPLVKRKKEKKEKKKKSREMRVGDGVEVKSKKEKNQKFPRVVGKELSLELQVFIY